LRKDLPVIDELTPADIDAFLREEVVGRIGCHADGVTYVVPIYFAYDGDAFYVQSIEGRKVEMMRAAPEVCFEVDRYEPESGSWRSVIAYGRYEELDEEGAQRALSLLVEKFAERGGTRGSRRPEASGRRPVAFAIRIERMTGRAVRR
jgi:nitroimidazol reductase NimA-like FMN-containing flavoprotein (pyridoxamine 5'-phosphate oxidase superfamily)